MGASVTSTPRNGTLDSHPEGGAQAIGKVIRWGTPRECNNYETPPQRVFASLKQSGYREVTLSASLKK